MKMKYLSATAAVAAALGLAACGGSKNAGVASLNGSGSHSGATTTTLPKGSPSQLLNEWAQCMRQNGYPSIADPTIDANKTIHINMPSGGQLPTDQSGNGGAGNTKTAVGGLGQGGPCGSYLTAASTALGGKRDQKPNYTQLEKFAKCMRSHGISDFPDVAPGGGLSLHSSPGSDLDPNSPTFKAASTICSKSAGIPMFGTAQPGAIQISSGNGGPGQGSSGIIQQAG